MQEREAPRLLQGAHIQVGGVDVSGRRYVEDYETAEAAVLIGKYMFQHAEPHVVYSDASGRYEGVVCRESLSQVVAHIWEGQTVSGGKRDQLSRLLRRAGFRAVYSGNPSGTSFVGWLVPERFPSEWPADDSKLARPARGRDEVKEPEAEPVTTKWMCPTCKKTFVGRYERDRHVRTIHAAEPPNEPAPKRESKRRHARHRCPKCRKLVAHMTNHMKTHELRSDDVRLLEAVRQMDGEHPRDYAVVLGWEKDAWKVSGHGAKLIAEGYLTRTGTHQSTRFHAVDGPPVRPEPERKHYGRREAKPVTDPSDIESITITPEEPTSSSIEDAKLINGNVLVVNGETFVIEKKVKVG